MMVRVGRGRWSTCRMDGGGCEESNEGVLGLMKVRLIVRHNIMHACFLETVVIWVH